jgi:hypothetical protein
MSRVLAFGIFVTTLVVAVALALTRQTPQYRLFSWILIAAGVLAVIIAVSRSDTPFAGLLVDETNRFNLPYLLTMGWLLLVVSGYLACSIWNVTAIWKPDPQTPLPVAIQIPDALWILAGIVGADVIADGIIRQQRRHRAPRPDQVFEAQRVMATAPTGTLYVRPATEEPRLSDLVTYGELGAQDTPDPAAIQKLLFQIAALVVYAVALGRLIYLTEPLTLIARFPDIPSGFLALLGVSTAVSITNSSVPH